MSQVASRDVVIPNPQGLHARPIAMLAAAAAKFQARFFVSVEGREVDGSSVLQLMTLCAAQGTTLTMRADGEDAEALIEAVSAIVDTGFGEM